MEDFILFNHTTVLLKETVDELNVRPDGIYVDCTLGGAGHSEYLVSHLSEDGRLICFDQDMTAIENAKIKLAPYIDRVTFVHSNFRNLQVELDKLGIQSVDGVLYDLGVSSPQLDNAERGFSYHQDAPLDMRMDTTAPLTAFEVVNEWDYSDLVRIFYRYGEEKFSKQIARKIEEARKKAPIETTGQLVELIKEGIPAAARRTGGHPAKRIFQAIRIAVNDELGAAEESLQQALDVIHLQGRVSVITFHSLEDRLTKTLFKEVSSLPDLPPGLPMIPAELQPKYALVTKKPILPTQEELDANNRSRSAKLRVIKKIKD